MRSVLILTDLSEAAFRAAEYVCSLADQLLIGRIVLYHAYEMIITPTEVPMPPVKNDEELYLDSMEALGLMRDRLRNGKLFQFREKPKKRSAYQPSSNALLGAFAV